MEHFFCIPEITHIDGDPDNVYTVTISTEELNRYGQVVMSDGYQLDNFKKNPVFLQDHGYSTENIIGRWLEIQIDKAKGIVRGKNEYFNDISPNAQFALELVKKSLAAFSIGFNVLERTYGTEIGRDDDIPDRIKKLNPDVVFKKIELLEISQVTIPANPSATVNESNPYVRHVLEMANEKNFYGRQIEVLAVSPYQESIDRIRIMKEGRRIKGLLANLQNQTPEDPGETYIDTIWNEDPAKTQKDQTRSDHDKPT